MNGVKFIRKNGGLGRELAGEDHISGLIVYGETAVAPTLLLSVEELAGKGITHTANPVLHYHISEFFRINEGAKLYVQSVASADGNYTEVKTLQAFAQGKLRQIAICDFKTELSGLDNALSKLNAIGKELAKRITPASLLYSFKLKAEDIANLPVSHNDDLTFMTQTTLSLDDTAETISALKEKYPAIQGPHKNDICYATTNRQQAVRELAKQSDLVVVVGSKNSSNSNRLAELASRMGVASKLIDDPNDIQPDWFNGVQTIGVTAGASAPEELVQSVIARMKAFGVTEVEELQGLEENMFFEVPKELRVKEVN